MRKKYSEYYHPSIEELKTASSNAWFVFDTNSLLDVLRLSPTLSQKTIESIRAHHDNIRIPANVDYEYHKHMVETPAEMISIAESAIKEMNFDSFKETFKKIFAGGKRRPLPSDCIEAYSKDFKQAVDAIRDKLLKLKDHYSDLFKHQNHQLTLSELLEDCLLPGFSDEDIAKIEKEGEDRYANKVPPGYMDDEKEDNKYGDLIIWKEMIELANTTKRNIFFVSNDAKEDWIYRVSGKTWGPRIELIREFKKETGGDLLFHIYSLDQFLENFGEGFNEVDLKVIGEQRYMHRAVGSITIRRVQDKPKMEMPQQPMDTHGKIKNPEDLHEDNNDTEE